MATVTITAESEKRGEFVMQRWRYVRRSSAGRADFLPQNVACPTCRMWATTIKVRARILFSPNCNRNLSIFDYPHRHPEAAKVLCIQGI